MKKQKKDLLAQADTHIHIHLHPNEAPMDGDGMDEGDEGPMDLLKHKTPIDPQVAKLKRKRRMDLLSMAAK